MSKRALILAYFVGLFILHQDFWWKDDPTLVFGILPVSLAYHVVWTLLVAFGWYLVTRYCWPHELDAAPQPAAASPDSEAGMTSRRQSRAIRTQPAPSDQQPRSHRSPR